MIKYFKYKKIIVIALGIILLVGVMWGVVYSLIPPDVERMEKCFQQDKNDLVVVTEYLSKLKYPYVMIDNASLENGDMFTGANTSYQKIDDTTVQESLNRLLNNNKYIVIGKDNDTVFFQKWEFLEKDRGIAVPINKEKTPIVEFIVKSEELSEEGWYYYEADYEAQRD